jgi:hypothetical protein
MVPSVQFVQPNLGHNENQDTNDEGEHDSDLEEDEQGDSDQAQKGRRGELMPNLQPTRQQYFIGT